MNKAVWRWIGRLFVVTATATNPLIINAQEPDPFSNSDEIDPRMLQLIEAADPATGESVALVCTGCHSFDDGGGPVVGPNLFNIVGAPVGRTKGYPYSDGMLALNAAGYIWNPALLDRFLTSPAATVPVTGMGFPGVKDDEDRAALISFLITLTE